MTQKINDALHRQDNKNNTNYYKERQNETQ